MCLLKNEDIAAQLNLTVLPGFQLFHYFPLSREIENMCKIISIYHKMMDRDLAKPVARTTSLLIVAILLIGIFATGGLIGFRVLDVEAQCTMS
jgi:hypothetical protein